MAFQDVPAVENYQFYIDVAFKHANRRMEIYRGKNTTRDRLKKSVIMEQERIHLVKDALVKRFEKIMAEFPVVKELDEFYAELAKCFIDMKQYRQSLAAVRWAITQIKKLFGDYVKKIGKCKEMDRINGIRKEFYGRVCSVIKQIKDNLRYLELCRKEFRKFPVIKTKYKSVAIIGFPNVGKTTLLYKLTGSKPEIKSYAFTTKSINVAYMDKGHDKLQLIDTPGSLNRLDKMNDIEMQSYLAVKLLAEKIVYVFDPTEASYPMAKQEKLFKDILKFKKPVLVYLSKTDLMKKVEFKRDYLSLEELKQKLLR